MLALVVMKSTQNMIFSISSSEIYTKYDYLVIASTQDES